MLNLSPDAALLPEAPALEEATSRRNRISIGGREVRDILAAVMSGAWGYELNFFRVATGTVPPEPLARLASSAFISLAVEGGCDMLPVRLAASTGASFELAILPFIKACDRFAEADETTCGQAPPGAAADLLARELFERLKQACPDAARVQTLARASAQGGSLSVDAVAAVYLLECGVARSHLPFMKFAARLPVAAAAFLAETRERPNRFVGLAPGDGQAEETEQLAAIASSLLAEDGDFATAMVLFATGRRPAREELPLINAALVAGAEYGGTSASAIMARLANVPGATCADVLHAVVATFGGYHLGALKSSATLIADAAADPRVEDALARHLLRGKDGRARLPGFGHRFLEKDPRAQLLLASCREHAGGRFIEAAAALEVLAAARRLGYLNMDGIGAAMGLQTGFDEAIVSVLSLVARAPGIAKVFACPPASSPQSLKVRRGLF